MKNYILKIKYLFLIIFFVIFLLQNNIVFAQLEVNYPSLPVIAGEATEPVTDLPSYVKYIFVAGTSFGFLIVLISLVASGVMYFLSPINPQLQAEAKDRIVGSISGLLILLLSYLIIITINPQLNIFTINKLTPEETDPVKIERFPGVYFFKDNNCKDTTSQPKIGAIVDLGELKKNIGSVEIIPDSNTLSNYIAILYENPNLWGKCQYLTDESGSGSGCLSNAQYKEYSSASIYSFDFDPQGDGVYFFRKPCLNYGEYNDVDTIIENCKTQKTTEENETVAPGKTVKQTVDDPNSIKVGGYYYVPNDAIKDIYVADLNGLEFQDVPEDEQICTKYNDQNQCTERKPQTLAGENISSIIVNGDYLVLMVYFKPSDDPVGQWSSCQEFPKSNDENWLGPRQIRWDMIRNTNDAVPNYVIIIPIKK